MTITSNRREFIKKAATFSGYSMLSASGVFDIQAVSAESVIKNSAPSALELTLKKILKGKPVADTDKISLKIAKTVDYKTPTLITVQSDLKDAKAISILVEQNPDPLVVTFELTPTLVPIISARLKLMRTSFVFVMVETEKVFYSTKVLVNVSTTGCGA